MGTIFQVLSLISKATNRADFPHRGCDFEKFSSLKPGIMITEDIQQVAVFLSKIEDEGPGLLGDMQQVNADKVVEHPACCRGVEARFPF
ncbi:hypothetical protein C2W62_34450 [Candidatus Entotheonella serta]|nr:hypothetical protein C2W62_34450 [Candidatus Entotheonella serta]